MLDEDKRSKNLTLETPNEHVYFNLQVFIPPEIQMRH